MPKFKPALWFTFAGLLILLGRVPAIIAPPWDIDEGLYASVGQALARGELLYRDVWDNKMPGVYFLFSWISQFNPDPTTFRLIATMFLIATAGVVFLIARRVYRADQAYWALTIFSTLAIVPIFETNVSNAEVFFLLPTSLAILLTVMMEWGRLSRRWYLAVGVLLGLGFLFKVMVVFDALAIVTLLLLRRRAWIWKELGYLALGGALVLIGPLLYVLSNGLLSDFIRAAFLNNFGYVGSGNLTTVSFFDVSNPLITVLGKLGLLAVSVWTVRRYFGASLTPVALFYLWLSFTLFGALLSGRPYLHYLIASLGAITLLIPDLWGHVWPLGKLRSLPRWSWLKGVGVVVAVVLALVLGFWGKVQFVFSTPEATRVVEGYYANAYQYLTGQIGQESYYAFFGETVTLNLKLRDYLLARTAPTARIYIWGNAPWVYYLSGRAPASKYLVTYQLTFVKEAKEEVMEELSSRPPELIILTNEPSFVGEAGAPTPDFPEFQRFLLTNYRLRDRVAQADIYERVSLASVYEQGIMQR